MSKLEHVVQPTVVADVAAAAGRHADPFLGQGFEGGTQVGGHRLTRRRRLGIVCKSCWLSTNVRVEVIAGGVFGVDAGERDDVLGAVGMAAVR